MSLRTIFLMLALSVCCNAGADNGTTAIRLRWSGDSVDVAQPAALADVEVSVNGGHVVVSAECDLSLVLSGHSGNGSITITGRGHSMLTLDNLSLSNPTGNAIMLTSPKGARISLTGNSTLADASRPSSICLFSKGNLEICGPGTLAIEASQPHSRGIRCNRTLTIGNACIDISHSGDGGRGISAGRNLHFVNSRLTALFTGDGGEVMADTIRTGCYTPRVIEARDSMNIMSGTIDIRCTGLGGKGIVCDRWLTIGRENAPDSLLDIRIATEGTAVVNDTLNDKRFGCPKAIKSGDQFDVYSGNIRITTLGMGGEGMESRNMMCIIGGNIHCDTFDDCINTGRHMRIIGGRLHCLSHDNDALDSNGSIAIFGGEVYATSLHPDNECVDTEQDSLSVYGGTLIGFGRGWVKAQMSRVPFFSSPKYVGERIQRPAEPVDIPANSTVRVMDGDTCVLSAHTTHNMKNILTTVFSDRLKDGHTYRVTTDGDADETLFEFTPFLRF